MLRIQVHFCVCFPKAIYSFEQIKLCFSKVKINHIFNLKIALFSVRFMPIYFCIFSVVPSNQRNKQTHYLKQVLGGSQAKAPC